MYFAQQGSLMTQANRQNNVLRGAILAGSIFLIVTVIFITYVNIKSRLCLNHQHITLLKAITGLIFIFLTLLITRRIIIHSAKKLNGNYQTKFTTDDKAQIYEETKQQINFDFNKANRKHAVLALHSLGGSPGDFSELLPMLKKHNIDFYVPRIIGSGINQTDTMESLKYRDWLRAALEDYDLLKKIYDKVTIIGQSLGGLLAVNIALSRKVDSLLLSSPAIYIQRKGLLMRYLLRHKTAQHLVS